MLKLACQYMKYYKSQTFAIFASIFLTAVLLADEPTGNLDSVTTIEVIGLLKASCKKYSQTILMVTHNEAIAQTCDRIIHIEDGRVLGKGFVRKHFFSGEGGEVPC